MDLKQIGWDEYFEKNFSAYNKDGYKPARITAQFKGSYRIYTEFGEMAAGISGSMRYRAGGIECFPTVGDWVAANINLQRGESVICGLLNRKSKFSRKMPGVETQEQLVAANVDIAFLVMSLNSNFNLRRIERYLVSAWEGGACPVIILSKADLCSEINELKKKVEDIAFGVPIHVVSCTTRQGIEEIKKYIVKGKTAVFMGSSGVGKSTIINTVIGQDLMKTGEIREDDDRGRHTTTNRQLLVLPDGGVIIDTPGMRELQLWDASAGVGEAFEDIERLSSQCRFSDCRHEREPGCAVNKAVYEGIITRERLLSYKKLQKEIKYIENKQAMAEKQRRKGDKKITVKSHLEYIEGVDLKV